MLRTILPAHYSLPKNRVLALGPQTELPQYMAEAKAWPLETAEVEVKLVPAVFNFPSLALMASKVNSQGNRVGMEGLPRAILTGIGGSRIISLSYKSSNLQWALSVRLRTLTLLHSSQGINQEAQ